MEEVEWVLTWAVREVVNLGVEAPVEVEDRVQEPLATIVREVLGRLEEAFDYSGSLAALAFVLLA